MTIQEKAAKKLRQFNNHTPHTDTKIVLDEVIKLIDEKTEHVKKIYQETGQKYWQGKYHAYEELKEELEK